MALDLAALLGGIQAITCPTVHYGPRASNIKKSLTGLSVQLGSHVLNAHAHVCKAPDVRVIMDLQDVRIRSAINACKTCRQVATVQCRPC
jgi:hypothetical protein